LTRRGFTGAPLAPDIKDLVIVSSPFPRGKNPRKHPGTPQENLGKDNEARSIAASAPVDPAGTSPDQTVRARHGSSVGPSGLMSGSTHNAAYCISPKHLFWNEKTAKIGNE
ncbi:hypothetical protein, partial [Palleronia caenipelagi]|uniref:hypothetical protein n=1 Tax=Palleronia caenipelagi TaxID=2489174 RepID=UPI001C8F7155